MLEIWCLPVGNKMCDSPGMTIFDDLAAEQERLEKILFGLDEAQWMSASGAAGWSIADVVLHLAQSEEGVAATVSHQRPRTGLGAVAGDTMDGRAAEAVLMERAAPAEVFARWQRQVVEQVGFAVGVGHAAILPGGCDSEDRRHSRGSTGSDSRAKTAKTHSWTRHRGSPRATRSRASRPRAYSRSASERLWLSPRWRSRSRLAGSV